MTNIFKNITLLIVFEYLALIIGCFIIAISFNVFLCPNKIASGGVPGLSIILHQLLGISTVYIQLGINLPLFILGVIKHGSEFGCKTALGSFVIPLFVLITQGFPCLSGNMPAAAIIGGMGVGIGLYFVFISNGSVGGFSLLAQIMHDHTKMRISGWIMILNTIVILLAGFIFSFSGAMYALISLATTCISIDLAPQVLNLFQPNPKKNTEKCDEREKTKSL